MSQSGLVWDFFIAHAGADQHAAEALYELLRDGARVFLDSRSLNLGDDWDRELARAQRESLVTVVLISRDSDLAFYQRVEIAAAIDLARLTEGKHRVVPVYLQSEAIPPPQVPYGLRLKHGLFVVDRPQLHAAATRLLELLAICVRGQMKLRGMPQEHRYPPISWTKIRSPKLRETRRLTSAICRCWNW